MTTITIGKTEAGNPVALHLDKANRHGLVTGATGVGKCWGRGTRMIMFDGSLKAVEKIQTGDLLMGPDSTPRTVLSTVAGHGPLYRIVPVKGEPWVCNDVHILSLRCIHTKGLKNRRGDIVNVPLNEYLTWDKTQKHIHKLWRTGVEFEEGPLKADPYLVGLYLAEGSSAAPQFNLGAHDKQLIEYVEAKFEWHLGDNVRNNCAHMSFSRYSDLWQAVKNIVDPDGERYIPRWIKHNTRPVRLACLAGILDGDGSLSNSNYDFISKHKRLAEDVAYVCRSLGLAAYVKECTKGIKALNFTGTYWRVSISGHTDMIPLILDRKRAPARQQIKDVLNTGFRVEPIGEGEYFGFELSGDRLCLLWDFTVTHNTRALQHLAEGFSDHGIPVFMSDIKGDLSGMASPATDDSPAGRRAAAMGLPWAPRSYPVRFWDLMGKTGLAMRTSIQDMGRMLTANMLECTDAQDRAIGGVFQWAKDMRQSRPPVLNLEMLGIYLEEIADLEDADDRRYGGITKSTARALYGKIERIDAQGGEHLFGEPALDIADLLMATDDGRGVINMLDATELMERPRLYGTWLTYLLMRLFKALPEVGDIDKPKLVFFFDEAHLLFKNASAELLEEVERMVRLIRSRGVGVYFVTQSPTDVPDTVLAQLGNRIQFALRAFTPKDISAVKKIAETYRLDPAKKPKQARQEVVDAITTMGVGEALVSTLQPDGTPMPVTRVMVAPPCSSMGRLSELEWSTILEADPLKARYGVRYEGLMAEWSLWERTYPAEFAMFQQNRAIAEADQDSEADPEPARQTFREWAMEQVATRVEDMRWKLGLI